MSAWFRSPIVGLGSLGFLSPSGPIQFIPGQTWALYVSDSAAILAAISVFLGSTIWTVIIEKAKDVNSLKVQPDQLPLGIEVSAGGGLICAWVGFGFLVPSTIPATIMSVYVALPPNPYDS